MVAGKEQLLKSEGMYLEFICTRQTKKRTEYFDIFTNYYLIIEEGRGKQILLIITKIAVLFVFPEKKYFPTDKILNFLPEKFKTA